MAYTKARGMEAFCATCPSTEEVTTLLQTLGFELTFQMDIDSSPEYEHVPPLLAQFHFEDNHGTEAIFLAGPDADLDGIRLPEHASRFWIYPGADAAAFRRTASALAVRWLLIWQSTVSTQVGRDVA